VWDCFRPSNVHCYCLWRLWPGLWPKIEWPKIEWPKIEWPKIEWPKMEWPKIEWPKIEWPKIELPKIELPKIDFLKYTFKNSAWLLHFYPVERDFISFQGPSAQLCCYTIISSFQAVKYEKFRQDIEIPTAVLSKGPSRAQTLLVFRAHEPTYVEIYYSSWAPN